VYTVLKAAGILFRPMSILSGCGLVLSMSQCVGEMGFMKRCKNYRQIKYVQLRSWSLTTTSYFVHSCWDPPSVAVCWVSVLASTPALLLPCFSSAVFPISRPYSSRQMLNFPLALVRMRRRSASVIVPAVYAEYVSLVPCEPHLDNHSTSIAWGQLKGTERCVTGSS